MYFGTLFQSEESRVCDAQYRTSTDKLNSKENMKRLANGKSNWLCYETCRYWFVMMESIAQTCDAHKTVYGLPANRMDALFFAGKLDGCTWRNTFTSLYTFASTILFFWMVEYWQLKLCMHRVTWLQTPLEYHKRKSNIWSYSEGFCMRWSDSQKPGKWIESKNHVGQEVITEVGNNTTIPLYASYQASASDSSLMSLWLLIWLH